MLLFIFQMTIQQTIVRILLGSLCYDMFFVSMSDIDECSAEDVCPDNSVCINKLGTYNCSCEEGYRNETFCKGI